MTTIKCPVCGQPVDDQSSRCPHCNTPIAGHVTKCPACGTVYMRDLTECPKCHQPNAEFSESGNTPSDIPAPPAPPQKGGSHRWVWVVTLIVIALLAGGAFVYYEQSKKNEEEEAYKAALNSDNTAVLQNYLDTYGDGNEMHKAEIEKLLNKLKLTNEEWNTTLVNNSKQGFQDFLKRHPDTPYKDLIRHKIDSIDWAGAVSENTIDAFQAYLDEHADGEHYDEAEDNIKNIKTTVVQPEEEEAGRSVIKDFFSSINSNSENALSQCVSDVLSSFLGKTNATEGDVIEFMHRLWNKENLQSLTWYVKDDFQIKKREVGLDKYDYTVNFSAFLDRKYSGSDEPERSDYTVTAHVNPDGQISSMEMKH